ncbi:hypothetical protein IAR55_005466 [Kwoniella newhampshirensis]|uniref:Zn(2)-C6 fungal-type domain-containing protein n=1 Tax=Kwoniella newhampshirensis TaxID=1651941 RepID=A0AAW0YHF7_9TREE
MVAVNGQGPDGSNAMAPPPVPPPRPATMMENGNAPPSSSSSSGAARAVSMGKPDKEKTGRQSFSCAECRRLKLKCSREWPCTSCEKRGCAQICPNGEMRTGKGKRLILADTAELHQRISILEVALAQAHAKSTATPHPLLESPYLFSPRENVARPYPRPGVKREKGGNSAWGEEDDVLQGSFGTLTIGQEGQAKFVGSFAGSEYLREGEESDDEDQAATESNNRTSKIGQSSMQSKPMVTPPTLARSEGVDGRASQSVDDQQPGLGLHPSLFAGGEVRYDLEKLRDQLPDYDLEGRALVESYWENVNWQYQPLPRTMFENDHALNAYDTESAPNPHKLACVFLIMAIGCMFDLNRPPFHPRGQQLFLLGRACISTLGIENASPATVQALHLMGTYILNDKRGNGAEVFWPILGTAVKIAQSLGLHRDGSHFGLSQYEIEERRVVWWELVTYDRLQALCFGRPCSTSYKWSDTQMPEVPELIGDEDGFHLAKYNLMGMMERVIDVQTQTKAVSFTAVTQLDTELRELKKNLPEVLLPNVAIQDLPLDANVHPHLVIHRFGIRLQVAQMRLLLNRPLFARALKEHTGDPSQGKFGSSFIALFESAQEIVQLVKSLVIYHPSLVARWWFFWFHAFSSAVCLAAIAIRAPTCAFASPSFHGMSIVCDISAAAREGCRAKKGLPILLRLRKRAHQALVAASRSKTKASAEASGEEDDLSHLAGSAKLRRVQAPLHKRSVSSPGGTIIVPGVAIGVSTGDGTPSPNSGGSVATSVTLADTGVYEGIVPRFPIDPSIATSANHFGLSHDAPPGTTSTFVSEDPMSQYNSAIPTSWNGSFMQGQSPPSIPNVMAASPDFESHMGVDMDMSMALGIDRSMSMGAGVGNFAGGETGGHGPVPSGATGVYGPESEVFGFDFEAFVNQMGGG